MAIETIIPIIIALVIVFVAWTIFKKLFRVLLYAGVALIVLIAAVSFVIYSDVSELKKNFKSSEKKILLVEENSPIAGYILAGSTRLIEAEELQSYSADLEEEEYETILGESYRLLVFDIGMFSDLDTISINGKEMTGEYAKAVFRAGNPYLLLIDREITNRDIGLDESEANNAALVKAAFFSEVVEEEVLSTKNPLLLFSGLREGSIIIYPESALFKASRVLPLSFVGNYGKKIFAETKEKAESIIPG